MIAPFRLLPLLFLASTQTVAGQADHDAARAAVQAGEVRPLEAILAGLPTQVAGELLDAQLQRSADHWRYVLKLLDSQGQMREVTVDGATGAVLLVEGR
ncbi:PepSY domain-containing protein [Marinivivus vitaminiproducens]|uniref:PepSY domain-containing protein n=1 Tax=Marinivivus vitaminiproducens TaxID=3035935 RepID=UPI00279B9647|nr:hypothetical protein P4R82_13555 [Geminicoccaceae bacterium SCSIO 64248]